MPDQTTPAKVRLTDGLGLAAEREEVLRELYDATNQTWRGKRARWARLVRAQDAEIERLQRLMRELWRTQDPDAWDYEFAAEVSAVCKA